MKFLEVIKSRRSIRNYSDQVVEDEKLEKIAHAAILEAKQSPFHEQTIGPETAPAYIQFICQCGQRFKLPTQKAGQKGRCPKCQESLIVPMPGRGESK